MAFYRPSFPGLYLIRFNILAQIDTFQNNTVYLVQKRIKKTHLLTNAGTHTCTQAQTHKHALTLPREHTRTHGHTHISKAVKLRFVIFPIHFTRPHSCIVTCYIISVNMGNDYPLLQSCHGILQIRNFSQGVSRPRGLLYRNIIE